MRTATVHIPDNCPLCGHKSVTPAADGSGYRCGQPPCGWGIFTAPPEQAKVKEKTMSAYQGGLGAELVAPPKFMGSTPTKPKKVKALKSKYKRLSEYKVGDKVTLQSSPQVYVLREQLGGGAWRAITYDKMEEGQIYLIHERYMKPYYEQKSSHSNPEDQNQVDQLAVETKSWWGSSIPKNIAVKGGFSGRKKDKLGRQRCYSGGKPTSCNNQAQQQIPQAPKKKKQSIGGRIIHAGDVVLGGLAGAATGAIAGHKLSSGGNPLVGAAVGAIGGGVAGAHLAHQLHRKYKGIGGHIGRAAGGVIGAAAGGAAGFVAGANAHRKDSKGPATSGHRVLTSAAIGGVTGAIGGAAAGTAAGHYAGEAIERGVRKIPHAVRKATSYVSRQYTGKKSLGLSLRDHHKSIGGKIGAAIGGVVGAGVGLTGAAAAAHGVTSRPRSYGILKSPAWTAGAVGVGAAGAAAGAHVGGKVGEAVEHGVRKVASHFTGKPAAPKSLDVEGKGGFTGRRKDKLKRERCYNQGKLVPCGQGEAGKQKPAGKEGQGKEAKKGSWALGAGITAASIAGIIAYVYIDDVMRKRRARDIVEHGGWNEAGLATIEEALVQLERIKKERIEERAKEVEKIKNNPNDPIRAGFERMQFHAEERQALREAEVTDVRQLISGGVDENYVVTMADGGKGLWKPVKGEGVGIREGASPGTGFRRAVAASAVADLLGFDDLVPTTEFRELNREPGSIQHFVNNAPMAFELPEQQMYDGDEDAARAAVYDYIVGHMDRHAANWLIDGGKLVLIDNGLSFPDVRQTGYGAKMIDEFVKEKNLPMPDISRIQGKWPQVEKLLKECGLKPTAIAYTKARYDTITSGRYQKVKDLPKMYKLDFEGADAGRGAPSPGGEAHSTGEH